MELRPLLGILAALPASALAADYLSAEQARKLIYPQAEQFDTQSSLLDLALMQRVHASASSALASGTFTYALARKGGSALGAVVIDEVIGKFEKITYAVGVDADGTVRQVEILSYRESHGAEVRLPAWRRQFGGKTAQSALSLGDDIANISGATLSCTHITEGVRRIVTVIEALRQKGALK